MDNTEKFFFEDETDEVLGIETATYDNGGKIKRAKLSNGDIAVIRRLKGRDMKQVESLSGGSRENAFPALMAIATKVNEKQLTIEEIDELWSDDFNKIKVAATSLNF